MSAETDETSSEDLFPRNLTGAGLEWPEGKVVPTREVVRETSEKLVRHLDLDPTITTRSIKKRHQDER